MTKALVSAPASQSTRQKSRRLSPHDEAIANPGVPGGLADGRGAIPSDRPEDTVGDDAPRPASLSPREEPGSEDNANAERLNQLSQRIASQLQRLATAAHAGFEAKVELGLALIEARGLCKRGEWNHWLEQNGMKPRSAQECVQFARHRGLFEENAHGRAHWTTEDARRLLTSHRKASGQDREPRPTRNSRPDRAGTGDHTLDFSHPGEANGTTGSAAEPSDPRSTETTSEDQCDGNTGDPVEPAGGPAINVEESPQDGGQGRQRCSGPVEPSDEDWLASIPLRRDLADLSHFDQDAILWRRARSLASQLSELISPTPDEVGRSTYFKMARNRYRLRLLFGLRINDPKLWRICSKCRGQFTDRPGTMPCSGCEGVGFLITHEGEEEETALAS